MIHWAHMCFQLSKRWVQFVWIIVKLEKSTQFLLQLKIWYLYLERKATQFSGRYSIFKHFVARVTFVTFILISGNGHRFTRSCLSMLSCICFRELDFIGVPSFFIKRQEICWSGQKAWKASRISQAKRQIWTQWCLENNL